MARNAYPIHPRRPGTRLPPSFVAYGRWLGVPAPLEGVMIDSRGHVAAVGRVHRNDRELWVLVFTGVPTGQGYRLRVTGSSADDEAVVDGLEVVMHTAITVTYPTQDDLPVGTTFIAYGTTSETVGLGASLTPASGEVDFLFGPPDNAPYWAYQFRDVDVGTYTLSVAGGNSQTNRTVDVL